MINKREESFTTPVSYLFYNRPQCIEITFPTIQRLRPKKLYLLADGPKNSDDNELCKQARNLVDQFLDWECQVTKIYSEKNLGLAHRTVSAIDQIFKEEENLIFLEDDNLVDVSFFFFCHELLEKYKYNLKISHIAGCNFYEKAVPKNYSFSYLFSSRPAAWGFATWKRAWKHMDLSMKNWANEDKISFLQPWCCSSKHAREMKKVFDQHCMNDDPWAWSYAWIYACWANNSLSIIPIKNLVSNIGFGPDATNTIYNQHNFEGFPSQRGNIQSINHPEYISRCISFDKNYYQMEKGTFTRRIKNKLKSFLSWK
jgi:hypothetical protein